MVPVLEALETHSGVEGHPWPPSPTRPTGYPGDLPFLEDRASTTLQVNGSTTVEWDGLARAMVEPVARRLAEGGWVERRPPGERVPGMVVRTFSRHDRQRVLIHDGRKLTLLDSRAE